MKRRPGGEDDNGSPSDVPAEAFVSRFLRRHPKFFVYVGLALGGLIVITLLVILLAGGNRE